MSYFEFNNILSNEVEKSFGKNKKLNSKELLDNIRKIQEEKLYLEMTHKDRLGMSVNDPLDDKNLNEKRLLEKMDKSILLLKDLNNDIISGLKNIKINNISKYYHSLFNIQNIPNSISITKSLNEPIKYNEYNIKSYIEIYNENKTQADNIIILDGIIYDFNLKNKKITKSKIYTLNGMNIIKQGINIEKEEINPNIDISTENNSSSDNNENYDTINFLDIYGHHYDSFQEFFNRFIKVNEKIAQRHPNISREKLNHMIQEKFKKNLDILGNRIGKQIKNEKQLELIIEDIQNSDLNIENQKLLINNIKTQYMKKMGIHDLLYKENDETIN